MGYHLSVQFCQLFNLSAFQLVSFQFSKIFTICHFNIFSRQEIHGHKIQFTEEICKQDANFYLVSLEVNSLVTNIPLDRTIGICIDILYNDNESPHKIPKDNFCNLLTFDTKELFFIFDNKKTNRYCGCRVPLIPIN